MRFAERKQRILFWLALLVWPLWLLAQEAVPERHGVLLQIQGAIGPATSDYLRRSMDHATEDGAEIIVLRMDTPGGLDLAMRDIIRDILASPIPVVGFVAPEGARAASAGTYILYATHVAAMAPATHLGAATPVQLLPGAGNPDEPAGQEGEGDESEQQPPRPPAGDAMTRKAVEDAVAYIQGLARLRGRNAEWAERAVREAVSLSSDEALKMNVIDLIARNTDELLESIHGRTVQVTTGELTLNTEGLTLIAMEPDWRSRLLAVITDPNVAYILMLIGIYGLIFEFMNPGTFVAGIAGSISLLLALFAFQVLPINYAGAGLILLGIALMVAEAFAPSFGVLGIGGVIAFVIGSVILIDTDLPGFGISTPLIGAFALFGAVLFAAIITMVVRSRRQPVVSGMEQMTGAEAVAMADFEREGPVRAHGELWNGRSEVPVSKGQRLRVTGMDGLTLKVTNESDQKRE